MQPLLLYTIGYPGAGKTTVARRLTHWFNGVHLQADKIGMQMFIVPTFSEAERQAVYQRMDALAIHALQAGRVVLFDANLNSYPARLRLQQLAAHHNAKAVGVWVQVPFDVAKTRAGKLRDVGVGGIGGRILPPEIFDRYAAALEQPSRDETYVTVDGVQPFSQQYNTLRRQLAAHGAAAPRLVQF
jgi:predicted kinase